jgi:protein-disulfide isomerase
MKKSHITIISLLLMVGAFAVIAMLYNAQQQEAQNELASEHVGALIKAHSVRVGNPDAKVTIVEFMDPACGTCAQFHPLVKDLIKHYQGKVNLVIRYAPFHQNSDQMVAILEASRKQNKFWEVLELMFATQEKWVVHHKSQPAVFWDLLARIDIDMTRLQKDINDPAIRKVIQQDIADGALLGATKTPTFIVNGKHLPSFGSEQLQTLIETEIEVHY